MSARYRVYARDVLYQRLGEIDDYGELKVELRFNDVGGWHLTASAASKAATLFAPNGGIIVTRNNLDGDGPEVVFSGFVTSLRVDAQQVEIAGSSDDLILYEKRASPDPTTDAPPYATEQDLREGVASTVMLAYVRENAVVGEAAGNRGVPGLTLGTDTGIGSYVYGQARWITLLALLQELALAGGGLRFRILQSDVSSGTLVFSVTEPPDLTDTVIVSKGRGTLGGWTRTQTRPTATKAIILGQGQGIDRQVVQASNDDLSAEYGYEIEMVGDRRDTTDTDVLTQTAANALEEGGETSVVGFTPVDTAALRWGVDYDIGSVITVQTGDGETLQEVVRGVNLALTVPSGGGSPTPEVQPIVSTPGDTADDPASRQKRATNRRVSNLERNIDSLSAAVSVQWNIGDLRMTTRAAAAAGWLLAQGQAVSRSTYSGLFGVIGTTYGAGDGSTTFNVPDIQDRFPIGKSGTKALGSTGGAATVDLGHTHTGPSHTHTGPSHSHEAGTLEAAGHTHGLSAAGVTMDFEDTNDTLVNLSHGGAATVALHHKHTADVTGSTDASAAIDVSGNTAAEGTGATGASGTGATGSAGSAVQSVLNPYLAVNFEVYAAV